MTDVDPALLHKLSVAVLAALRRDGRLPTRLDEEDYEDLAQEGILAALVSIGSFDPSRGNLRTYLSKPIARAQLKAAWRTASVGITGDHRGVPVFTDDEAQSAIEAIQIDDVADEIEAFDYVWHTHYVRDST